jgi:hypothetical protein
MKETLDKVSVEIGTRFVIDDRTWEEGEWECNKMGDGRSMPDLR